MPTNATVTDPLWGGAQLTHTYNSQSRLSASTIFVPDGYTATVRFATLTATYAAPVAGRPDLAATAGGTAETLGGRQGMRWALPIPTPLIVDAQAVAIALRTA